MSINYILFNYSRTAVDYTYSQDKLLPFAKCFENPSVSEEDILVALNALADKWHVDHFPSSLSKKIFEHRTLLKNYRIRNIPKRSSSPQ
jgi:hypothetical protein